MPRNRSSLGRQISRPILVAVAFVYFFRRAVQQHLLKWGPAVSLLSPRLVPDDLTTTGKQRWFAPIDRANDSLRLHHERAYKIFDAKDRNSALRGPETVLVHPVDHSVYVLTETAQLVQLLDLLTAPQEKEMLQAKNYSYKSRTAVVQADLGPGRPLGGSFTPDGTTVYIADAALGLTRLQDFANPLSRVQVLASQLVVLHENGDQSISPLLYVNSLVVGPKSGKVYFTDSTDIPPDRLLVQPRGRKKKKKNVVRNYRWDTMYAAKMDMVRGKPAGRLCEYDPQTGQVRVLADHIHFANGIGIDADETFVVVAETFNTNFLKFDLLQLQQERDDGNHGAGLLKPSQYLQPQVLVPSHEFTGYIDNAHCGSVRIKNGTTKTMCYGAIISEFAPLEHFWRKLPDVVSVLFRSFLLMVPRYWAPKIVPKYTAILVVDPSQPYSPDHKNFYYIQDPSGQDLVYISGVTVSPDHQRLYLGSLTNQYVGVHLLDDGALTPAISHDTTNVPSDENVIPESVVMEAKRDDDLKGDDTKADTNNNPQGEEL